MPNVKEVLRFIVPWYTLKVNKVNKIGYIMLGLFRYSYTVYTNSFYMLVLKTKGV